MILIFFYFDKKMIVNMERLEDDFMEKNYNIEDYICEKYNRYINIFG